MMSASALDKKYELEPTPIAIRGKKLTLHVVKNWDVFVTGLEEKGEDYIKDFPFWVKIWEASIVLADHLMGLNLDAGKEMLEIGAGMGVTGLFLGAQGHRVTITDNEEDALELLRVNVERNNLENVTVKKLDWNDADRSVQYDVILGSELIYRESEIDPLIALFRRLLRPGGTVYLAHDVRRMCMMKFIGTVPGEFEITNTGKTLRGDGELHRILIHRLRLK